MHVTFSCYAFIIAQGTSFFLSQSTDKNPSLEECYSILHFFRLPNTPAEIKQHENILFFLSNCDANFTHPDYRAVTSLSAVTITP